jgi:hypothetical protein
MSPIHCGPLDSVRVFLDTVRNQRVGLFDQQLMICAIAREQKCKKALGMHWG